MKHLKDNNETYLSHFLFASKVGINLIFRGILFLIHAILPICDIPKKWNLSNEEKILHLSKFLESQILN